MSYWGYLYPLYVDNKTLTALEGVRVGHSTSRFGITGFTAVLFDSQCPVAYCSHGGGPGTFNTETLQNGKAFNMRDGLFVTGGSLSGLMAVNPLMQCMIDDKIGDKFGKMVNPALSGAVVFDLGIGVGQFDPLHGKTAYEALSTDPVTSGNVGAGTGTTVGKFYVPEEGKDARFSPTKAGVGSARIDLGDGACVCVMSVVNALGNVVKDGKILAGARQGEKHDDFISFSESISRQGSLVADNETATTVTIVGTNIDLGSRENYERVANLASHGQVRAIDPVNCFADGDTVFVFSTEKIKLEGLKEPFFGNKSEAFVTDVVGQIAAQAVQESIYDACHSAESILYEEAYQGLIPAI